MVKRSRFTNAQLQPYSQWGICHVIKSCDLLLKNIQTAAAKMIIMGKLAKFQAS